MFAWPPQLYLKRFILYVQSLVGRDLLLLRQLYRPTLPFIGENLQSWSCWHRRHQSLEFFHRISYFYVWNIIKYLGMVLFARITLEWHILVHAIILWNWATLISNIYRKLGYWLQVPLPVVHVLVVSASVVNAGNQSPLTSSSSLSLLSPSVTSCVSVNGGTLGLNQATDTQHMVTSAVQ